LSPRRRDTWSIVALLMALMLPWQSFAAAAGCDLIPQHTVNVHSSRNRPAAHEHCGEHEHLSTLQHHGCCADCCLTAAMAATFDWSLPHAAAPEHFLPAPHAPMTISLDRLDRPPRQST
jgi:hypothetical protein